ncbi:CD9 antigen isoform X1 [Amphiprion ocellaris]|uniref:Tetraspanin n=1 Tax=Amphiprion ocellaris TaxID=80972 RepID=A0A3Q1BSQ8_AMPOC|nr:CD9 antigen isoform X1 [Amphiprion ocellaris]
MALDGCGLFCKYILVIFNIIFAVVGLAFFGLGLWLRFSGNTRGIFEIEELNSSAFVIGVTVLIVLGAVMLIVVTFGDYGACNEKRCALQVFSILLAFLATGEIVVGVLAYTQRDEVGLRIAEFYTSMYTLYAGSGDPAIAVTLTFIHNALHCCGVTGIKLIEIAKDTCPKPDGLLEHLAMPNCPVTIAEVFDSRAPLVMGIFIGTGALLITALICSMILCSKIRQSVSSPQYIILTQSTPALAGVQLSQHEFVSTSYPEQDPVIFTPLTMANIPVAQA